MSEQIDLFAPPEFPEPPRRMPVSWRAARAVYLARGEEADVLEWGDFWDDWSAARSAARGVAESQVYWLEAVCEFLAWVAEVTP